MLTFKSYADILKAVYLKKLDGLLYSIEID